MNLESDAILATTTMPEGAVIEAPNPASNQNAVENQVIARRGGKWVEPGVPHTGWTFVGDEDLEEPAELCGMCMRQKIRYVHVMTHPQYPGELRCGCVCSGNMAGDLAAAQVREKKLLSRAGKWKRWAARVWKTLDNGNLFTRVKGTKITVFPRDNGWRCAVAPRYGTDVLYVPQTFESSRQAQLAAFDFARGA